MTLPKWVSFPGWMLSGSQQQKTRFTKQKFLEVQQLFVSLISSEMFHTPIVPRVRKRSRPAEACVPRREEVKFEDVRLYLVERKMGSSRRSFLTQLARSKGFIVDDVLRLEKSLPFCCSMTEQGT